MSSKSFVILLLLISWAPITGAIQGLVYLGPVVLTAFALLTDTVRLARFDGFVLLLLATFGIANSAFYHDTGVINPAFGLLTYSPLLILAIRFPAPTRQSLRSTIGLFLTATAWLSIIQASLGVVQITLAQGGLIFEAMTAGDYVVGTLGTNSHLYAAKMLFQGLLLGVAWWMTRTSQETWINSRLILVGASSALIGALLASALLFTATFFAAIALWGGWRIGITVIQQVPRYGIFTRELRRIYKVAMVVLAAGGLLLGYFFTTQPENARLVISASQAVLSGDLRMQKFVVLEESVEEVLFANPRNALFGSGLGRYSSRAAMILSGGYIRQHPSWLPISRSTETTARIYSRWNQDVWDQFDGSITAMPTSSFQSVLVEYGIVGTILILAYGGLIVRRMRFPHYAFVPSDIDIMRKCVPVMLLALAAVSITDLWLGYASLTAFLAPLVALGLSVSSSRRGLGLRRVRQEST